MRNVKSKNLILWITALLVFIIDFNIKNNLVKTYQHSYPIIKNILYITLVCNSGAIFGILSGKNTLLIYLSFIFILIFFFAIKNMKKDLLFLIAIGLILGGAISNLVDRIIFGCVIDYIDLRFWPIFNISDVCINFGFGLLIIDMLKKKKSKSNGREDFFSR